MHLIDMSCGSVLMAFQNLFMGKNASQPKSQHVTDVYLSDRKRQMLKPTISLIKEVIKV